MSRICRFTTPASRDLEAISDYIASDRGFDASERFISEIMQKCQNLSRFPNLGRKRDELALGLRSLPVGDYLIFYRLIGEELEIVRVVSGYRNLEELFSSDD